jgi:hypothetical protein
MTVKLDKIIEANVASWVRTVCQSKGVQDAETIDAAKGKVRQYIIDQMEAENIGMEGFTNLLAEGLRLLEEQLEEISPRQDDIAEADDEDPAHAVHDLDDEVDFGFADATEQDQDVAPAPTEEEKAAETEQPAKKKDPDRLPKAKVMTERLQEERKPIKELLTADCVKLGLVERKRANYLITQLAGKKPKEAELEVVMELRNNLHKQIKDFIRKHKGGPWATPTQQEEIRLDIVQTPTIRSLIFLTKQLFKERQKWLADNAKGSLLGDMISAKKPKK